MDSTDSNVNKVINFLGKQMLKQLLGVGTLWSEYIKGQRDPRPTKSQFACSSMKVTFYLVPAHKKRHPGKNPSIWYNGYFSTNTKAKSNKNPSTFQSGPHLNANASNSTPKSHKFPSCHSVICLKLHLHWDVNYAHEFSDHFHNAGQLDVLSLSSTFN